jgi:hypothetical protein
MEDSYHTSFIERVLSCATQKGQNYKADAICVHNLTIGFVPGESLENWIQSSAKHHDGRLDMIALCNHYAVEGNCTHCIADAKNIQSSLHYNM